jgi:hypothetical protein
MQLIDGVCQKHCSLVFLAGLLLKEYATYVKSMSYQGLSQRGINEKSVCIRGRSAKQHGDDRQNAMSSRVHHGL